MKKFTHWGDRLPKTSDGTDPLVIESEAVDRGQIFRVEHASIIDETTKNKLQELGIKRGEEYNPVIKRKAGTNDYDAHSEGMVLILIEGEQLYGKVHSPTSGDKCYLVFGGELFFKE